MTLNLYDLTALQRNLVRSMIDETKKQFPDVTTDFDIWLNPDNKEHILVNVNVPFYDNEREIEFGDYTAELSCETYEQSGVLISLMPHYNPTMPDSTVHEETLHETA